jgi:hypothetical protein
MTVEQFPTARRSGVKLILSNRGHYGLFRHTECAVCHGIFNAKDVMFVDMAEGGELRFETLDGRLACDDCARLYAPAQFAVLCELMDRSIERRRRQAAQESNPTDLPF